MKSLVVGSGKLGTVVARRVGAEVTTTTLARLPLLWFQGFKVSVASVENPESISSLFRENQVVFIILPPRAGKLVPLDSLAGKRVFLTSSTGIYGDRQGEWVDEATPLSPSNEREKTLVEVEERLKAVSCSLTILRLGGLVEAEPLEPTFNWVTYEQAADAITFAFENNLEGIFNVAHPPPSASKLVSSSKLLSHGFLWENDRFA